MKNYRDLIHKLKRSLAQDAKNLQLTSSLSTKDTQNFKVKYLGRKGGLIKVITSSIDWKSMNNEDKHTIRQEIEALHESAHNYCKSLESLVTDQLDDTHAIDLSLPPANQRAGSLHPITLLSEKIALFFQHLGFEIIEHVPCVTNIKDNFDFLNVQEDHPARSPSDTFYISEETILRTHTTCVLKQLLVNKKPPFRCLVMGPVFRRDQDRTHTPMFHQFDLLIADKDITLNTGKTLLFQFINHMLAHECVYRLRPSHFPFTEPSIEIDVRFKNQWLECLGAGMVHSKILHENNANLNYKYFASGLGIERLAMIMYNIKDLGTFYHNDIRILKQFNSLN